MINSEDWEVVQNLPKINQDLYLLAHLALVGKKIIDPVHARSFGLWLHKHIDDVGGDLDLLEDIFNVAGFSYHYNHRRSTNHEWFQEDLPEGIVIPVDECLTLAQPEPGWDDGVTITRLVYSGDDLDGALDMLFRSKI